MEELTPAAIAGELHTRFVGQRIVYYPILISTNDLAKELAKQGASSGTTVIAEEQTAGRGRMARTWYAPAGSSLLFSVILRPHLEPSRLPQLLMASALATAAAIERSIGLPVGLKWPNDVILRGKKAGGILIEAALSGEKLDYAVIGIGLNVNLDVSQIPQIAATATSISMELGSPVSRLQLLVGLLQLLETEYTDLESGVSPHERWAARLTRVGEQVEVETPWGRESGRMEGVDADGALMLRRTDGTVARITVGDVT